MWSFCICIPFVNKLVVERIVASPGHPGLYCSTPLIASELAVCIFSWLFFWFLGFSQIQFHAMLDHLKGLFHILIPLFCHQILCLSCLSWEEASAESLVNQLSLEWCLLILCVPQSPFQLCYTGYCQLSCRQNFKWQPWTERGLFSRPHSHLSSDLLESIGCLLAL